MKSSVACILVATWLSGCGYSLDKRYGPNPVLDPASIEASVGAKARVLAAFAAVTGVPEGDPGYWYAVTQSGFDYVDDECRAYFQQIFFLNRDRERTKAGLGAAGAATAAILGVTGGSATSLAAVAQVFGLGMAATDIASGAYLYQLPPAATQGFVKELQLAYRQGISERRALIVSASASYQSIQGYLELCLPATIEAKLAEHISSARALPDPTTRAKGTAFGINLVVTPPVSRPELSGSILGPAGAGGPVGGGGPVGPPRTGNRSERRGEPKRELVAEEILAPAIVSRGTKEYLTLLQEKLCVPVEQRGAIGPTTKAQIEIFEGWKHAQAPGERDGKLTDADTTVIRSVGGCAPGGARNLFEKAVYRDDDRGRKALEQLVDALNLTKIGEDLPKGATLEQARPKIAAVRESSAYSDRLPVRLPAEMKEQVTYDFVVALPRPERPR